MLPRLIFLAAVLAVAGCGETGSPSTPATPQKSAAPLPPEVEFDPATATQKYQKSKKAK
jgi:hypothetical protein